MLDSDGGTKTSGAHYFCCPQPSEWHAAVERFEKFRQDARQDVSAVFLRLTSCASTPAPQDVSDKWNVVGTLPAGEVISAYGLPLEADVQVLFAAPGVRVGTCSAFADPRILKMAGSMAGHLCTLLLDTGASDNFVSSKFVAKHNLRVTAETGGNTVVLGSGDSVSIKGTVRCQMSVGAFKHTTVFSVLDLADDFDVIMGLPWLTEHCDLNFSAKKAMFRQGNRRVSVKLRLPKMKVVNECLAVVTSKQMSRLWNKKDNECFLVVLKDSPTLKEAIKFAPAGMPEFQALVDKLTKEFEDVFAAPDTLPPERDVAHCILTEPGARPPYMPCLLYTSDATDDM
jgi:hypothetical protein